MFYKAIVFDMGGVLFQWNPQIKTTIPVATLRDMAHSKLWSQYEQGDLKTDECYRQLSEQHGVSPEEIDSTFRQSTACLTADTKMTKLLHELKARGLAIFMMTNIPQRDFDQLRSTDYEWDLFDAIFASGYVGMRKPDHAFYEHVLQEIGIVPSETIFIDDKDENVVAAREVGMAGLLFDGTRPAEVRDQLIGMVDGKLAARSSTC